MITPDTTTNPSTLDTVLAGLLKRRELAEQLGCGERTIIRRERQGMPFISLGMLRLYDPLKVRAWLVAHERGHDAPKRGRPAKRVAA
jgi:hypothetical protein